MEQQTPSGAARSLVVTGLWIYPLKSGKGVPITSAAVEPRGFRGDRRWMLVDEGGVFLSQRTHPRMALLSLEAGESLSTLSAPGSGSVQVRSLPAGERRRVRIWDDEVEACDAGDEAAGWLTAFLGRPARLVFMPEESRRPLRREFTGRGDQASFADAYPYLLIGEESLAWLNARLDAVVPMNRFRPNIAIGGSGPFEEDTWRRILIGGVPFHVVKPCVRCVVTTVDQARGERAGEEPLTTLARFRRSGTGVLFGQNCVPGGEGEIRLGDPVEILETGPGPAIERE
jgi:hypothetical protein